MYYLTIGTLWKNENYYALDFIRYHRAVGVEHFVIFNNADEGDFSLEKLLSEERDVEVIRFAPGVKQMHQEAWGQLIGYNQGKTKWLALIDADQCLVPVQTDDVRQVLKNYEDFASLQLNWKAFGSGHQDQKLPGSVYERFLMTSQNDSTYNAHCQFICQPDRTLAVKTAEPHYPHLPAGEMMVNTNKEPIDANKQVPLNPATPLSFNVPPLHDVMWVAHYTNKSREEWQVKNAKGRADILGEKMPSNQFDEYEAICNDLVEDRAFQIWKLAQIRTLKDLSYRLGYWTACWDDGAGVTTQDLKVLEDEVEKLYKNVLRNK